MKLKTRLISTRQFQMIKYLTSLVIVTGLLFGICWSSHAQSSSGVVATPKAELFFLMSLSQRAGLYGPPLPWNPYSEYSELKPIPLGEGKFLIDDRKIAAAGASSPTMSAESGETSANSFSAMSYGANDLWLEMINVDMTIHYAYLLLHNTTNLFQYQLFSNTNLFETNNWIPGLIQNGDASTDQTLFYWYIDDNPAMFFLAHQAEATISITTPTPIVNAIEPKSAIGDLGQVGVFYIHNYGSQAVTAYYNISGTAQNGIDYANIANSVTIPANSQVTISIQPIEDGIAEPQETVTLTLARNLNYLIDHNAYTATIKVLDTGTSVQLYSGSGDTIEPDGPPGQPAVTNTFYFERSDERGLYPALPVYYTVSGTASNGVDYTLLSGTFTFPEEVRSTNFGLIPLGDNIVEGVETVTLTLTQTNGYYVETNTPPPTLNILDSSTMVSISSYQDLTEAPSSNSTNFFTVYRNDTREVYPPLTVRYLMSGTASNGVDYSSLSGYITFAEGEVEGSSTNIYLQALKDYQIEGDETVTLTLGFASDSYFINTNQASSTLTIHDTIVFEPVVSINRPVGIDYHEPLKSLIVSYNYSSGDQNFARIYTNGMASNNLVVTNWTGIQGVGSEVKLATVKNSVGGFTTGDTYFCGDTAIGRISADGTSSNLNWGVLNDGLSLRGVYVDQTGLFGNNVIAVTTSDTAVLGNKGVWRVNAQGQPTLVANINTFHLEGVITLPNTSFYGPLAGKIITGDEEARDTNGFQRPLIYTISPNGTFTTIDTIITLFPGGIFPEDFDIIRPNQDLYICDYGRNQVVKLSANYLTDYVDDLLITDAGEIVGPAKLFIVHWDASSTSFVVRSIIYPDTTIEHVTFAPINLPPLTP
ncbi:MAG: Calx-beta domain-containing protein [Limisphaerales bacterium]